MHFDPEAVRSAFLSDSASYLGLRDVHGETKAAMDRSARHTLWPMPHHAGAPVVRLELSAWSYLDQTQGRLTHRG